ncbi:hypothetical protein Ocin01_08214 [Orchesella cincta]|uniref:Uncharacterized protein n=1 Tax=Orchesella cincta TaxID=48709 RepID=A0A1D2N0M8_ORCCI|nr:hypothetical protein Ocin01_08214 [Orchesella cincta]
MEKQYKKQLKGGAQNEPITHQATNENDLTTLNGGVPVLINYVSVIYSCQFYVEPEVLNYYYSPPATSFKFEKPILEASSMFDGPCGTKWHVTTTFIRWVGVQRWVSLYLTRVKDESSCEPLHLQCEFRIVDKDGNVLRSMRNKLSPAMKGGETRGFTKFMPFTDMKRVITEDNWLKVEAHITFIHNAAPESPNIPQPEDIKNESPITEIVVEETTKQEQAEKTGLTIEEYLQNKPPFIPTAINYVEEDDQVHVWYNDKPLAITSRKLLLEKSNLYRESVDNWRSRIDFCVIPGENPSEHDILQGLQFLHQNNCEYFQSGSYDDVYLHLLPFAEQMRIDELIQACLIELFLKVELDFEDAAMHIGVIQEYKNWIGVDAIDRFRLFFQKNFESIQETESFCALSEADDSFKEMAEQVAFDPLFSFEQEDDSENGEIESVEIQELSYNED